MFVNTAFNNKAPTSRFCFAACVLLPLLLFFMCCAKSKGCVLKTLGKLLMIMCFCFVLNVLVGGGAGARVVTVPRGINPGPWLTELQKTSTRSKIAELRERLKGRKVTTFFVVDVVRRHSLY